MLTAKQLSICLRPQFVWDNKSAGKWMLANVAREHEYFQKELGILVFINLAIVTGVPLTEVQQVIGISDVEMDILRRQLSNIMLHDYDHVTQYQNWRRNQVNIKTGLCKNLIAFNFGIRF